MPTAPDSCEVDVAGRCGSRRSLRPTGKRPGPQRKSRLARNSFGWRRMSSRKWVVIFGRSIAGEVLSGAGEFIDISEGGSNLFLAACSHACFSQRSMGFFNRRRLEWQHYFSSFTGRGVAGIEGMHYDQAIFSRDFWGFLFRVRTGRSGVSSCGVP